MDSSLALFVRAKEVRLQSHLMGVEEVQENNYWIINNIFRSSVGLPLWKPCGTLHDSIFTECRAGNWLIATVSLQVSGGVAFLAFCLEVLCEALETEATHEGESRASCHAMLPTCCVTACGLDPAA